MAAITPLLKFIEPGMICAEIGVRTAESSQLILKNSIAKLYCIDPWKKFGGYSEPCGPVDYRDWKASAMNVLQPWEAEGKAVIMEMDSLSAATQIPDDSLDFVFIDANHSFEYVLVDCVIWWNKIKKDGIISGHDYTLIFPPTHEVKKAVDFWANIYLLDLIKIEDCWVVHKK